MIMNLPQIHIARHLPIRQHPVKMLRPRLRHAQMPDRIKIRILDRRRPARLRRRRLARHNMLHRLLPRPRRQLRIRRIQIYPRQPKVEMWLDLRLIARLQDALRLQLVTGFEAGLLARDFVFQIKDAPATPDQPVSNRR